MRHLIIYDCFNHFFEFSWNVTSQAQAPTKSPFSLQCEAPKIAKLVYNSNFTMAYGTYNELVMGVYKPTIITGGPHIV